MINQPLPLLRLLSRGDPVGGDDVASSAQMHRPARGRGQAGELARKNKTHNPFLWFDSSPEVIRLVVKMYVRYPLSLRSVEDGTVSPNFSSC